MFEFKADWGFRSLFEAIHWKSNGQKSYQGDNVYADVLAIHLPAFQEWMKPLIHFGDIAYKEKTFRTDTKIDNEFLATLFELYALSRVNDGLLGNFQPITNENKPIRTVIEKDDYSQFMKNLGFQLVMKTKFHPFYHEIVQVEQCEDPDASIEIVEEFWSCFMLGNMLFSRAGMKVSAGINYLVKEIAENSRLYWSYTGRNRPTTDYSMGWGSNSQWGTMFRRDYEDENFFYYNVDARSRQPFAITEPQNPSERFAVSLNMSKENWIDFLRYRCLTKFIPNKGDDLLYDFSYTESKG